MLIFTNLIVLGEKHAFKTEVPSLWVSVHLLMLGSPHVATSTLLKIQTHVACVYLG